MKYIGYEESIWKYLKHDNIECKKYKINQFGDVLNVKTNSLMQPFIDKHGYVELILGTNEFINGKRVRKHFKIHACVFITFGDKKDVKKYLKGRKTFKSIINHKDGCKRNNYIKNLEVISQKENIAHAIEIGLKKRE